LNRPAYEENGVLHSCDLKAAQRYLIQRMRRHNRHLHGWGVICGLQVVPGDDPLRPWSVRACPGYAVGPYGDEIVVVRSAAVDVRDFLWLRPVAGGLPAPIAYVGIRYAECPERQMPKLTAHCQCDESVYVPTRIREGFEIDILWTAPVVTIREEFPICQRRLALCPECPADPHVFLARLTLPTDEGDPIEAQHINNVTFQGQL
jgi:hypothetical protein